MDSHHANGVLALQERLNDPDTVDTLNRLLDRIGALEQAVTVLAETVRQAPGMVAMVTDIVDETYREARASGTDLEQQFEGGLALLRQLTEPRTVAVLSRLIERLDTLEPLLDIAEQAPATAAMVVDIVDDAYRQAKAAGVDLDTVLHKGAETAARLGAVVCSAEFDAVMDSGVLEPKTLRVIGSAGQALATSQQATPKPVGLLGALGALRDPEVRKALGFAVTFAKQFGRALET
jgi:hypothetical protein